MGQGKQLHERWTFGSLRVGEVLGFAVPLPTLSFLRSPQSFSFSIAGWPLIVRDNGKVRTTKRGFFQSCGGVFVERIVTFPPFARRVACSVSSNDPTSRVPKHVPSRAISLVFRSPLSKIYIQGRRFDRDTCTRDRTREGTIRKEGIFSGSRTASLGLCSLRSSLS